MGEALVCFPLQFRVPTVQCSDSDCESEVVRRFPWLEHKVFDCRATHAQQACCDLVLRPGDREGDGFGRTVDGEHMSTTDLPGNSSRRCPGTTADLQKPKPGAEGERVDDRREACR